MAEATVSGKGQITIPKSIRRLMGIKANDKVIFVPDGEQIILQPVKGELLGLYGTVKHMGPPIEYRKLRERAAAEMAKKAAE